MEAIPQPLIDVVSESVVGACILAVVFIFRGMLQEQRAAYHKALHEELEAGSIERREFRAEMRSMADANVRAIEKVGDGLDGLRQEFHSLRERMESRH